MWRAQGTTLDGRAREVYLNPDKLIVPGFERGKKKRRL